MESAVLLPLYLRIASSFFPHFKNVGEKGTKIDFPEIVSALLLTATAIRLVLSDHPRWTLSVRMVCPTVFAGVEIEKGNQVRPESTTKIQWPYTIYTSTVDQRKKSISHPPLTNHCGIRSENCFL
jgi:hypothetical protein